ncbi:MAG TPA: Lrp/AsnC family transcriptional regulator [Nitrososphaerales archaeon]|nr:Lrp/AsnC family transcriptional regulator [Nitrososphaerales archaeon]
MRNHSQDEVAIDQLDERILARLLVEGRTSFRQMAQEFHTSTSTVSSRVSRLEKSGVIKGYSATVNFEALGYDLTAVTEIVVSKGKLSKTEREIARLPGVCAVYDVTGENDGIVVAKFRRREELSRFAKGLLSMPFVERANTHVVLATVKEDFRVPL